MKMTCQFAKGCMKQFWQGTLGDFIHDEIVLHLLICDDCFVDYIYEAIQEFHYGAEDVIERIRPKRKRIKEDFEDEIEELIEDIRVEFRIAGEDSCRNTTPVETFPEKLKPIKTPELFMEYYDTFDLQGLLMLRSFKDLCNEFNSEKPLSDDNPKSKFYKFLTKKICQRVDFLEKCYNLDYLGNE